MESTQVTIPYADHGVVVLRTIRVCVKMNGVEMNVNMDLYVIYNEEIYHIVIQEIANMGVYVYQIIMEMENVIVQFLQLV